MVLTATSQRSPGCAAVLSFVLPGAGQLYNGERPKGLAVLCITAGVLWGFAMATVGPERMRSWLSAVMLGLVYLFVWIPAVLDAYQRAAGQPQPLLSGGKAWYVILMLLTVGPMALPLLWQSPRFSRRAKILWTIAVVVIALLGILLLVVAGPAVEGVLRSLSAPVP